MICVFLVSFYFLVASVHGRPEKSSVKEGKKTEYRNIYNNMFQMEASTFLLPLSTAALRNHLLKRVRKLSIEIFITICFRWKLLGNAGAERLTQSYKYQEI